MRRMRELLEAARRRKFVGVAELAQEAARILAESGVAQARGTVTELPDERMVRYYLTEGLIPPADEKQGTASVFGFRHLLQLLAVKKLQAEHLPIRAIREVVTGKTERQLEKLLGAEQERGAGHSAKGEALGYLESLLMKGPPTPGASAPAPSLPPPSRLVAAAAPSTSPRETWARVELEPGLEVHVSDSYRAPREEGALRRLSESFLNVLRARGARSPKRGGK